MAYSKFFENATDILLKQAAKMNEEYVFSNGKLRKGQWTVLPNGSHVFLIDKKIAGGPPNLIGKSIKDITTQDLLQQDQDDEIHPSIINKYKNDLAQAQTIEQPKARELAIKRIQEKMRSEHINDGSLSFLTDRRGEVESDKPTSRDKDLEEKAKRLQNTQRMDQYAKDFSDYGDFPENGSPKDQAIWYQDRLSLLQQMQGMGGSVRDSIAPVMQGVQEQLDRHKQKNPDWEKAPMSIGEPPAEEPVVNPAKTKVPKPAPVPGIEQKPKRTPRTQPKNPVFDMNNTGTTLPPKNPGQPVSYPKGKDIIQTPLEAPSSFHRPIGPITTYRLKEPQIRQDRPYAKAGLRFKTLDMINIEAGLRNAFIQTFRQLEAELDKEAYETLTKEFLSHIK